jgi:hypothetical protein
VKKYFRKLICAYRFLKKVITHPVFVWFIILFGLLIIHFKFNVSVQEPIFVIFALTAGWVVAFHTTYWNQKQNFINKLKYDVANSLILISSNASRSLVSLDSDMRELISKFDLRKGPTGEYLSSWGDIQTKVEKHYEEFTNCHLSLLGKYEENEILFLNLRKLINVFNVQWSSISSSYYKFIGTLKTLILVHESVPREDQYTEKIRNEANDLSSKCLDTVGYLYDLRIELLNKTLGPIVNEKVPEREPQDPEVKILSNLAKKDVSFDKKT